AYGAGKVTSAQVSEMLGSLGGDLIWPLLECVVEGDGKGTLREAERILARSVSADGALEELASLLHRIAIARAGAGSDADADAAKIDAMAKRLDEGRLQVMYQIALLGRRDLPLAPDETAGFTMTLLRMLSFAPAATQQGTESTSAPARAPATKQEPRAALPAAPAPTNAFDGDWPA